MIVLQIKLTRSLKNTTSFPAFTREITRNDIAIALS